MQRFKASHVQVLSSIHPDEEIVRWRDAQAALDAKQQHLDDVLRDAVVFAKELVFIEQQRQLPVTTPVFVAAHALLATPLVQDWLKRQEQSREKIQANDIGSDLQGWDGIK